MIIYTIVLASVWVLYITPFKLSCDDWICIPTKKTLVNNHHNNNTIPMVAAIFNRHIYNNNNNN